MLERKVLLFQDILHNLHSYGDGVNRAELESHFPSNSTHSTSTETIDENVGGRFVHDTCY